jgi:flagellar biosynthesis protein FliQ
LTEDTSFKEMYRRNRWVLLGVLMMPVVGMVVAILLIVWRFPDMKMIAIPIIVVIMAQYLLLVKWINDRINAMLEKGES